MSKKNWIIFIIIIFLVYIFSNKLMHGPAIKSGVKVEPVASFQNIEGTPSMVSDTKGNLYVYMFLWTETSTKAVYYEIMETGVKKIDSIPANTFEASAGTTTLPVEPITKYQASIVYQSDLVCDAEVVMVKGKALTPVLINGKQKTNCLDLYGNNIDKWFVVRPGNVYGTISTKAYWLDGDKAYYIKEFQKLKQPKLIYVKSGDFWYALTTSYQTGDKNDVGSLYKISFDDVKVQ
jgi:hypothetical protein